MHEAIEIAVYGISFGFILFLAAAAFSIALGLMGVINASHGAVFMFTGFVGVSTAEATQSWLLGVLAAGITAGVIGLILYMGFFRFLYRQRLQQLLVTFGWAYILSNMSLRIWGSLSRIVILPEFLRGNIAITSEVIMPVYRIPLVGMSLAVFCALWWVQDKTKIGAIIRAGMDDEETVATLGINLRPVVVGAFCVSLAIAGMAAVAASPVLGGISFATWTYVFFLSIVIAVVGGVGSIQGTLIGSLICGIIWVLVASIAPRFPSIAMYATMAVILLFRPQGLFGRKGYGGF